MKTQKKKATKKALNCEIQRVMFVDGSAFVELKLTK